MYLNCHSFHSLRYGTIPLEDLVLEAKQNNVEAMALTDCNATTGIYDFVLTCRANGIKPIAGIEFRNETVQFIGLAKNMNGFGELCRLLTKHTHDKTPIIKHPQDINDCFVIYPIDNIPLVLMEHEYIGIRPEQLIKLTWSNLKEKINKMVILQPVTIRSKNEHNLHRILRAVENNVILSRLTPSDYCTPSEKMLPIDDLLSFYKDFPQIIKNTEFILDACNFDFDFKSHKNKKFYTNSRYSDRLLLESLAQSGMERRYGPNNKEAIARVKKEIDVIDKMGFSSYFLITWDIIRYSNSRGFLHIGRGSGANSIVSYCLGITDICPIELNLYFERFLNSGRSSAPDFDIDWSWKNRDTILDYIFKRFDTGHVAFIGTIAMFKYRSIIREVGKVFGLPKQELDILANSDPKHLNANSVTQQVKKYGLMLEKYPNARSMHSCGVLISEEPITNYMALEMPPKGFSTAQIDMHIAEDIGFEKFDILSQRGIGHINDAVKLVQQNRGEKIDIRNVSAIKDEKGANDFLREGNTIGCFYIESPAMRGLIRKLKCDSYKVLVAASSVIRPGVAKSGMLKEYIFRHNNPDQFEYFHKVFEEQLGETYGVMVYQEDVIKIGHHFAGLDLTDADILRRAMSGKTRSKKEFDGVKNRFFELCLAKGHPDQLSQEVFRQMESFAGYSFCKAHSASYAVESYMSLYLKRYYPIEFMVAVVLNEGGFYRLEVYLHEAKMAGATILNPCVNKGEYWTTLEGKDIYLGFRHLHSLDEKISNHITEERKAHGDYLSVEDFINRVPIGIEALQILIFIGAFRFTGLSKNELTLIARMILVNHKPDHNYSLLIQEPTKEYTLPKLTRSKFEDAFDEIELLGFPVSFSPFELLKTEYRGDVKTNDLINLDKKRIRMVGYLICTKQVPIRSGMMNFGTWIDSDGCYFDTTHWPQVLEKYPFQSGGCYLLEGIVDVDFGFPSIVIEKMAKLPFIPDPRYEDDKDRSYRVHQQLRADMSVTHRAPYPTEVALPRNKMEPL